MEIASIIIDDLNGHLPTELMTMSTNQTIESNVYITEILTSDANARIFNDMQYFADNIALIGQNNVIECRFEKRLCAGILRYIVRIFIANIVRKDSERSIFELGV